LVLLIMNMAEEQKFDAKKAKLAVKLGMPFFALLVILTFIVLPVKWYNSALRREAQAKNRDVERLIDVDVFKWLD
jgi:hypothetical protein